MRDPKRIDRFIQQLRAIWWQFPDMRFGQLMANFLRWYGKDIFYTEDDEMAELLEQFAKKMKGE